MITNSIIDQYNAAVMNVCSDSVIEFLSGERRLKYFSLSQILQYSCVELWSSSRLIAQGYIDKMQNGIELSGETLNTDVQLLLNMYCNDHMNHNDGTCCSTNESYTTIQFATFLALFAWWVFNEGSFHPYR